MTVGSINTITTPAFESACSAADHERFGRIVTWNGEDEPQGPRLPRRTFQVREAVYQHARLRRGRWETIDKVYKFRQYEPFDPARNRKHHDETRVPHNYSKVWENYDYPRFQWSWHTPFPSPDGTTDFFLGGESCGLHNYQGLVDPNTLFSSEDEYKLLAKLDRQVRGSDFNLASFLGAEGLDTIGFIADTTSRIYRSLKAFRKGRVNQAIDQIKGLGRAGRLHPHSRGFLSEQFDVYYQMALEFLRDAGPRDRLGRHDETIADRARKLARLWLEYHLAAEPLLGDVKAAAEQLAYTLDRPQRKVYRATRNVGYNLLDVEATYPVYKKYHVNSRVTLIAYLTHLPSLADISGVKDPEVVIWNAIPLTFVADWFLPIGDWLEARATSSHLEGTFVRSQRNERYQSGLWVPDPATGSRTGYGPMDAKAVHHVGNFTRTVTGSLPVKFPDFKPLGALSSWSRAATAVSLMAGIRLPERET